MLHLYRVLMVVMGTLLFVHGMAAHSQGLERRPCVAPDSPSGCASMPGAPMPPGAMPNPDRPRVRSAQIPLQREPDAKAPARPTQGTVTVGAGTSTGTAPPQPQSDTVGPPAAPK